ncbi:MAG TPA: amino acid permease [Thermoanaerobaculia bacterium]|nr:amino acid permease [Thermoanaerobaculia bacterium]
MNPPPSAPRVELVRGLSTWDGVSLTVGAMVGTGIFLTSSDIARGLPHGGLLLLVWLAGGLLSVAGALTYAELGAAFPRAGGIYHFLKEAYGPLAGFLYGWGAFLAIMSGGIAAIAVGFGEYLGAFLPFFSTGHVFATHSIGSWTWTLTGGQLAGALAILALTTINHFGLKGGALVQNLLTIAKIGALAALGLIGFLVPAHAPSGLAAPLPAVEGGLLAAFGVGMIAALWTYDGWYGLAFSAGEMRTPERSLPWGLIGGTALVTLLYVLVNVVYLRAIPVAEMGGTERIGEAAAGVLFGPAGARWISAAVLVSTFGCLAATILYSSRIYQPMAADGLFFRGLAEVNPRWRIPARSLWAQSLWAVLLTLSGTYQQLYTWVTFVALIFHVATGAALFVLRRKQPDLPRPYRVWGYPVVPLLFLGASGLLVVNTLFEQPVEALLGLLLVALGLPAFAFWKGKKA